MILDENSMYMFQNLTQAFDLQLAEELTLLLAQLLRWRMESEVS